jgi:hypothetical protein
MGAVQRGFGNGQINDKNSSGYKLPVKQSGVNQCFQFNFAGTRTFSAAGLFFQ